MTFVRYPADLDPVYVEKRSELSPAASGLRAAGFPTVVGAESPTTEKLPCLPVSVASACWLVRPPCPPSHWWNRSPTLRAALGERVRVIVENRLSLITTAHWHGKQHSAMHLVDLDAVLTMQSVTGS
jgi:hypothetical protein